MTDPDRKRSRKDEAGLPPLRLPPVLPRGPKIYQPKRGGGYIGPVTEPPPGFVRGTTSATEWMVYHAIARVLGVPGDPRVPPYIGFPGYWSYQKAFDEGRRAPGGAVIDFVVFAGEFADQDIAFRIQTEYFHIYSDNDVHVHDQLQKERLSAFMRVVDLYDQDFAWDQTNAACIVLVKRALAGETFIDPITSGTAERVTRVEGRSI